MNNQVNGDRNNIGFNIIEIFEHNVFNDEKMRKYLPYEAYKKFKEVIKKRENVDETLAEEIAHGVKEWAISRGVTHFAHWFQPMTGLTAEKHESFLSIEKDGTPLNRFSGKNLIKSEPDASSFPSGGIRSTFEARGYTLWDTSSPMFIIESLNGGTLCIPSIFLSYNGESLDKKTPLLRSIEAISKSACNILKYFGENKEKVFPVIGIEHEYFLIDKEFYYKREDLVFTGRTLFGSNPPKLQQLEDHYFGSIKERILNFMQEAEYELYKLGIPAKTRHNEVSPAQFELAPIYEEANIANDHNQLIMEILKKVALRNNLVVLFHEKPFARLNGSGKHNNWSLMDSDGENLFEPGNTPIKNIKFLTFLTSVILAVYRYNDLIRASISSASNDYRLGGYEAPPSIISIFLGKYLSTIVDCLIYSKTIKFSDKDIIDLGIYKIPVITKDNTDRNRTSPFAFTGNKFEFRAVGSSQSVSTPNFVLNSAVSQVLNEFCKKLENKIGNNLLSDNININIEKNSNLKERNTKIFNETIMEIIIESLRESKNILFEGDNYSEEWKKEAIKRKLFVVDNTVDAIQSFKLEKNISLLVNTKVLTEAEIESRYRIKQERYIKTIDLEAETLISITRKRILPIIFSYEKELIELANKVISFKNNFNQKIYEDYEDKINDKKDEKNKKYKIDFQLDYALHYKNLTDNLIKILDNLERKLEKIRAIEDEQIKAKKYNDEIKKLTIDLRTIIDEIEKITDKKIWDLPSYYELLYLS